VTMGVLAQVDTDLPRPEVDADQARALAERILADSEFDPPSRSFWQELAAAISGFFEAIGGILSGAGGVLQVLLWVALAAGAAAVLYLAVRSASRLRRRPAPEVRPVSLEASRTPAAWLAEAEALEAAGSWKEALRARYRGLVSELIGRRHLRDVPGRTTGEFRVELAGSAPAASPPFDHASALFDRAWYGDEPTAAPERDAFVEDARAVLERAGS
jgi:hypothetical protein